MISVAYAVIHSVVIIPKNKYVKVNTVVIICLSFPVPLLFTQPEVIFAEFIFKTLSVTCWGEEIL